jgi:hypothetical protein
MMSWWARTINCSPFSWLNVSVMSCRPPSHPTRRQSPRATLRCLGQRGTRLAKQYGCARTGTAAWMSHYGWMRHTGMAAWIRRTGTSVDAPHWHRPESRLLSRSALSAILRTQSHLGGSVGEVKCLIAGQFNQSIRHLKSGVKLTSGDSRLRTPGRIRTRALEAGPGLSPTIWELNA